VTCVECGTEVRTAKVCQRCGAPVVSRPAQRPESRQPDRRNTSTVARALGATLVVILNAVALVVTIGIVVGYLTQGSPTQLGTNYMPLWACVFIAVSFGSVPVITVAVWIHHLRGRARRRREPADGSPDALTIGKGQGAFLRADDQGLLMRNVPWGRVRRIAWTEIKQFADGRQVKEGNTYWLLVIALHTGKPVVALATHQWFRHPDETVQVMRELAERHGIPTDLTGRPPEGKGGLWSLIGM